MTSNSPPPSSSHPAPLTAMPNGGWDPRVRMFRASDEVDTFALVTARAVLLTDTMSTPELAEGIVTSLTDELRERQLLVVNTHADYDHCWGNAVFASPASGPAPAHPAPIIGHTLARMRLLSQTERRKLRARQRQDTRFANVRLVPPNITFTGTLRLDGGDLTAELIPTPGHTADHVAVWVPELRLVVAGDTAEHPWPKVGSAAALPRLRRSLERLRQLQPLLVLPCHGGTSDPGLITRNLAYFDDLALHARAALEAGTLPADWAAAEDLPARIGVPLEAAAERVGIDPATLPDLYRRFHLANARASVAHLSRILQRGS